MYIFYLTPKSDNYQLYFENYKFYDISDVLIYSFTCISCIHDEPKLFPIIIILSKTFYIYIYIINNSLYI